MTDVLRLNLIHLFTFYLTVAFLLSTLRRVRQYHAVTRLALSAPGRWPNVMQQIKKHWLMFLTWTTFRPAAIAIGLLIIQMICSRLIWPTANVSLNDLLDEWWMMPIVGLAGALMLGIDGYFIIRVGAIDRKETEQYLDEAEHWLTSWKAPMIRALTFGFVNPRKIVDQEVKKALEQGKGLLQQTLWWVSAQASARLLYGLTLWISWAIHPNLSVPATPPLAPPTEVSILQVPFVPAILPDRTHAG